MRFHPAFLLASAALVAASSASALTKANNTTSLNNTGSWVENTAPASSDTLIWDSTVVGANTSALGGNLDVDGLRVVSPGGAITVSNTAATVLTLGAGGVDMSAATQNLTFTNSVTTGAVQNWNVASGRTFTLAAGGSTLTLNHDVTLNGAGITFIGGASGSTTLAGAGNLNINSGSLAWGTQASSSIAGYTGQFVLNSGGRISVNTSNTLPALTINGGTIGSFNGSARTQTGALTIGGDFTVGGAETSGTIGNISSGTMTFSGATSLTGGTRTITSVVATTFSGVISNGGLSKAGAANLILTGTNTYTGATTVTAGGLVVGLNGLAGAGDIVVNAGTLFLGANGTTTAGSLSGAGGVIATNYNLSTDGLRTLSVNQTTDGVFAGVINNAGSATRAISLVKNGAAKLTLSGTNTYVGTTTINAGTLITGNTAALGAGSVVLAGGTLQVGNGTVQTVTLASTKNITATAAATLAFNGTTSAITLSGGGKYDFTGQTITLDLNNAFNTASTYNLIAGGTGNVDAAGYAFTNFDTTNFSASFINGTLSVTAIPEPSTYGLIGAGALAAVAFVRRRRRSV